VIAVAVVDVIFVVFVDLNSSNQLCLFAFVVEFAAEWIQIDL